MNTMENEKDVVKYEVPQIKMVEVEVEKGFAVSDGYGETGGVDPN